MPSFKSSLSEFLIYNKILSAYKDNVAFAQGPVVEQFAPKDQSTSDWFQVKDIESVISLKAETHNFPTTVEPFNGAATGTGGEIRDRMGGGVGSWPIAGTAVYMTAYPRLHDDEGTARDWEDILPVFLKKSRSFYKFFRAVFHKGKNYVLCRNLLFWFRHFF